MLSTAVAPARKAASAGEAALVATRRLRRRYGNGRRSGHGRCGYRRRDNLVQHRGGARSIGTVSAVDRGDRVRADG